MPQTITDEFGNTVTWKEIISETGTEHLFAERSWAAGENRDRALCGFHFIRPAIKAIPGKICAFCQEQARTDPRSRFPMASKS